MNLHCNVAEGLKLKNPGGAGGAARGGRGLGKAEITVRWLMAFIAAVGMATTFALPADARAKKQKRPAATVQTQQAPSLDGRTLGRMRTCGFDYLRYDGLGTPYGPYCH